MRFCLPGTPEDCRALFIKLLTLLHKHRCELWEEYFVLRDGIKCGSGFQNGLCIITRKDNPSEVTALLIINRQSIDIDGNFVFGDENRDICRYRCGCSHNGAAPGVEEDASAVVIT